MDLRSSEDRKSNDLNRNSASGFSPPDQISDASRNPADGSREAGNTAVDTVLQSDIGINTLLARLKQSLASAREFAAFLKKRSTLEEEQAQGLKKLCRTSHESARRPDCRQGSYAHSYVDVIRIHDRMAENGIQFALSLHQMHEDLHELAANVERGRKTWKQNGLAAEKRVQDSEAAMEKAKAKYNSLAEDYDRARTGDRSSGRVFGLKGPKSAAQHEDDLQRKLQQADGDYISKVQAAKSQREELVSTLRPQAVRALRELIGECDEGLSLQMQKFASFNERLALGNGVCVSPFEAQANRDSSRSLRDVVAAIDNHSDLFNYVVGFTSQVPRTTEIRYEKHHTLVTGSHAPPPASQPTVQHPPQQTTQSQQHIASSNQAPSISLNNAVHDPSLFPPSREGHEDRSKHDDMMHNPPTVPNGLNGHQIPSQSQPPFPPYPHPTSLSAPNPKAASSSSLPALRPSFGVDLDDLLRRDGSTIPLVVYQCIQAVDLFGLGVEGIYRISGSATHVNKLKSMFDHDPSSIDFRNPESFWQDINSVTGLLKQFFRELPDPLLPREHYGAFIEAARIDDDVTRRDSIHATINALSDSNYATLRALTLHLDRVQHRSVENRMNGGNLAIIFGPTLMGTGPNVADSGWQVRVIDTILQNALQIFDED